MIINKIYDISLFIDDIEYVNSSQPGFTWQNIDIFETWLQPIPTMVLNCMMHIEQFNYRGISDASKIKVNLKSTLLNFDETYYFRVSNVDKLTIQNEFVELEISCFIDFFEGYQDGNQFNFYGNSSDVFKKIGNVTKAKCDIDNTNDQQLWISGENNVYQFMSYMTKHGYVDDTSAMMWALDRHRILLYKNVIKLFMEKDNNIYNFIMGSDPTSETIKEKKYLYGRARGALHSGWENIVNGGYGGTNEYFDFNKYGLVEASCKKVAKFTPNLNINKEVSRGLSSQFYPIQCGNNHKNFYNAILQNERILSTFSSYITLNCTHFMPYRLGQIVGFDFNDAQTDKMKILALSNIYMIIAININITPSNVSSNLEIVTQGTSAKNIQETY